jgi:2-methylcitrate dehydratase PrpD
VRHAADIAALAAFVAGLRLDGMPGAVVERGTTILVDCLGCIVGGQHADEMRTLLRGEEAYGSGVATVLGRDVALPPPAAAFINGTAGTWHDLDEGNLHTKGHPGIQIVPAAFAEAEAADRTGAELLLSLIAGYEVRCRIYGATAARLAVHPHGTFGPLAAAVAIAKQRNWPAERIAETIAVAATLGVAASRGTLREGATVRNAYTGLSGRLGFVALDLVEACENGLIFWCCSDSALRESALES